MTLDPVITSDYSNQVTGFTKLFQSIVHSTVWQEEMHVKVVWVTLLALADRNGCVNASEPGLAKAAGVSLEQCIDALARFKAPDPYSRTKSHEGRRIQPIDGGWFIINHPKYRELASKDERRLKVREHVSNLRRRNQVKSDVISGNQYVINGNQGNHKQKQRAEAKAEAGKDLPPDGGWLAPYLAMYRQHVGKPKAGLVADAVSEPHKELGAAPALALWLRWCQSDKSDYGPAWFGQHWRKAAESPRQRAQRVTQQDRNFAAIDQAMREDDGQQKGG